MFYHHLYADADGASHWRDVPVSLSEQSFAPPARAIFVSEAHPARATLFLRLDAGWNEPIHPTPKRQYYVALAGRIRVTASDGVAREIGPGDVWLMEDTHGAGHHTQVLGAEAATAVMVQLD